MTDSELDNFIICKKCHTLHRKIKLHKGTKALCKQCDSVIYRHHHNLIDNTLAISWVLLIALIIGFSFSIMSININGISQELNLPSLIIVIFNNEYYLVGIMLSFLIFIFPVTILLSLITLLTLMKLKKGKYLVKRLLILVAQIAPWSMLDIFFISLLVAMVKLFAFAQLELGVAFGAFVLIMTLDIFIFKRINFSDLWEEYNNIYKESR
ncbi:MAG: paraquat-inducible protein A [Epsilonproteobacteria bacterium]|nr:paraquat-inducible protein A [Campylobacterota bacterium]